jgi:hypothetical protein
MSSGIDFEYLLHQLLRCACIFPDGLSQLKVLEDRAVWNNGIMGSFLLDETMTLAKQTACFPRRCKFSRESF